MTAWFPLFQNKESVKNTEVDGIFVATGGDQLTVSMLNMIAQQWFQKLHPELLKIVRTEYSKELRDNTALAALVPRISLSVDAMLSKYDKVPAVNYVLDNSQTAHGHEGQILKVNGHNQRKRNDSNFSNNKKDKKFCPGC